VGLAIERSNSRNSITSASEVVLESLGRDAVLPRLLQHLREVDARHQRTVEESLDLPS
jgi:hypothetical protein